MDPKRPATRAGREIAAIPAPTPTQSLQFKAVVAAVALVAVATGVCGWLTTRLARQALTETLDRDVQMLADTAARAIADDLAQTHASSLGDTMSAMTLDERIAFVAVFDLAGKTVGRRVADLDAWQRYARHIPESERVGALNLSKIIKLERDEAAAVTLFTRPVWRQTVGAPTGKLTGYLVLAMSDPSVDRLIRNQQVAAVAAVCIIGLLALPAIVGVTRHYTRPLRQMVMRTAMLAEGRTTDPVRAPGRDEIGVLASAFNGMAERLASMRAELIEANLELEGQVRQRTEQLRLANQQLVAQMHDKDEFIRTITHDLNAPIRNIAGMTKMLLKKYEKQLAADALTKLERIAANARTESELLADLLELSRLRQNAGKVTEIDMDELVRGILESLDYDLEAKRIELQVDAGLPTLHADRNRIRQVFQNLIDNAVKYMPDDAAERRVSIGADHDGHAATWPVFFVRDTGRGIDEKDHERVFQVFQRARYSGETDAAGRGVGLASVKTIIEGYGGRIWLDSAPGRGATFYFTFGDSVYVPAPGAEHAAAT